MIAVNHSPPCCSRVFVGNSDQTIFVEIVGNRDQYRIDAGLFDISEMVKEIAFCDLVDVESRAWLLDHVITIHQQMVVAEVAKQQAKSWLAWTVATGVTFGLLVLVWLL